MTYMFLVNVLDVLEHSKLFESFFLELAVIHTAYFLVTLWFYKVQLRIFVASPLLDRF